MPRTLTRPNPARSATTPGRPAPEPTSAGCSPESLPGRAYSGSRQSRRIEVPDRRTRDYIPNLAGSAAVVMCGSRFVIWPTAPPPSRDTPRSARGHGHRIRSRLDQQGLEVAALVRRHQLLRIGAVVVDRHRRLRNHRAGRIEHRPADRALRRRLRQHRAARAHAPPQTAMPWSAYSSESASYWSPQKNREIVAARRIGVGASSYIGWRLNRPWPVCYLRFPSCHGPANRRL